MLLDHLDRDRGGRGEVPDLLALALGLLECSGDVLGVGARVRLAHLEVGRDNLGQLGAV